MKEIKKEINVLEQFRAIAGVYSLTAIKGTRESWRCSIYRGGKRIGTAEDSLDRGWTKWDIESSDETLALLEWTNIAGPYGFESISEFIQYLMGCVFLLKEMREKVKQGKLVTIDLVHLDAHNMPVMIQSTNNRANPDWIRAYQKMHPEVQVVNFQLEV